MSAKSNSLCTTTAAIVLFGTYLNAHAKTLELSAETKDISNETYESIKVSKSGKLIGKYLTVTSKENSNGNIENIIGIDARDTSSIELWDTIIQSANKNALMHSGIEIWNGSTLKMTRGSIEISRGYATGALFYDTNSKENTLKDVKISSGKDTFLIKGVSVDKKSSVTLDNVTITKAQNSLFANNSSQVTISGGSFEAEQDAINAQNGSQVTVSGGSFKAEQDAINAQNGSIVTLNNNTQIISSNGYGLHATNDQSKISMTGGTVKAETTALLTENGGQIDTTNITLTTNGLGSGAIARGTNSTIKLHGNTTMKNVFQGLGANNGGKIVSENLTIISEKTINPESEKGHGDDEASRLKDVRSGIWTSDSDSEIRLTGKTTIQNFDEGLYADGGSKIVSGNLTIIGGKSEDITLGVQTQKRGSEIRLNGETVIENIDVGLVALEDAAIKVGHSTLEVNSIVQDAKSDTQQKNTKKNKIEAKKAVLFVNDGGYIDITDVSATAGIAGLQFVTLSENDPSDPQKYYSNKVNLSNTDLHVDNGAAILVGAFVAKDTENSAAPSIGTANLINSEIHADMLLGDGLIWNRFPLKDANFWNNKKMKEISNGTFTLNADHSTLEGRAEIAQERNVLFNLQNGTTWTLKTSTKEKDADGNLLDITQRSRSDVSVLNLSDSSIIFNGPVEGHFHTLHIGSGKPDTKTVYNASGDAKIYFNTAWSDGVPAADQKTDRLLIHGNVSGSTVVYIKSDLRDKNSVVNASNPSNTGGISLIQVSGTAEENSFKLAHGYTTKNGSPYKYTLTGYGPESSHGKANVKQNLFDTKDENFWDFRLHKEFLDSDSKVEALVPQMASYLVMPNVLFYTGLTDMTKQNALLANMRTSVLGKEQENGFFLYTYGNTGTFSSKRGPLKYGYSGADIHYAALQAGLTLAEIEEHHTTTHFGFVGTYGKLSFTPKDMQDASKSTLDKWTITAYGSFQHDNGFYIDTLLSYGILKGDITNAIIDKTAKVKNAKMWSISTTVGKQFATHIAGLTFEPQAQLAYQHLAFKTIKDADKFTIDMKNPHQWLIRVGGRLTKNFITTENGRSLSFYGKVNAIKTFGDDKTIHIDKDYQLESMGAFLEGGLGIRAQLSSNLSLQGDVSYQQKLQKTGISGISFSGGISYQF